MPDPTRAGWEASEPLTECGKVDTGAVARALLRNGTEAAMTAPPIELTLHEIPRWQSLVTALHERCADLASRWGEPGRWQVVVERRRSGEVVARIRVHWNRGYRHVCARGDEPLAALSSAFDSLAAERAEPFAHAG